MDVVPTQKKNNCENVTGSMGFVCILFMLVCVCESVFGDTVRIRARQIHYLVSALRDWFDLISFSHFFMQRHGIIMLCQLALDLGVNIGYFELSQANRTKSVFVGSFVRFRFDRV